MKEAKKSNFIVNICAKIQKGQKHAFEFDKPHKEPGEVITILERFFDTMFKKVLVIIGLKLAEGTRCYYK